jgi:hypothetical protein
MALYLQYAAVNFIFLLSIITLAFYIKSWFDQHTFRRNMFYANIMAQYEAEQMQRELEAELFDRHVETTPGMKDF